MVNEDKVILMTRMACYETGAGKKNVNICNYFRGDYIGFQVLKSIIAAVISFMIIFGVYIFYHFEAFMQDVYSMDLMATGRMLAIIFLVCLAAYGIIAYVVYAYRYNRARKSLKIYYNNLRQLSAMYDK